MPNAGDAGLALGAALYGYHVARRIRAPSAHGRSSVRRSPTTRSRWHCAPRGYGLLRQRRHRDRGGGAPGPRAHHRMGAGPRRVRASALGHRSILADPRTVGSKARLDDIKRREWFRPYGCSVLAEHADDYFELLGPSPSRLLAVDLRSAAAGPGHRPRRRHRRVQTVTHEVDPQYYRLIARFHELTGVPLVLNTGCNGAESRWSNRRRMRCGHCTHCASTPSRSATTSSGGTVTRHTAPPVSGQERHAQAPPPRRGATAARGDGRPDRLERPRAAIPNRAAPRAAPPPGVGRRPARHAP